MNWILLSSVAAISYMGAISPGPDFALVVHNVLRGNFQDGLKTTLGICTGLLIHISLTMMGLSYLIAHYPILFQGIQIFGACYLFYLGIQLIRSFFTKEHEETHKNSSFATTPFRSGFFCNVLNPKVSIFLIAIFTQILGDSAAIFDRIAAMGIFVFSNLSWFTFLSYSLSRQAFQKRLKKHQKRISLIMGSILTILAVKFGISS